MFEYLFNSQPFDRPLASGWSAEETVAHVVGKCLLAITFVCLGCCLRWLLKRGTLHASHFWYCLLTFVGLLAVSNVVKAAVLFWPIHRFATFVDTVAAATGVCVAYGLIRAFPSLVSLRTRADFEAIIAAQTQMQRLLRHKTRDLEHQLALRSQLEQEVSFLKELQLVHVSKQDKTSQSIARLESITEQLTELLQAQWPEGAQSWGEMADDRLASSSR